MAEVKLEELYEADVVKNIKDGMVELPCAQHLYGLEIDTERGGPPGCPECGCILSYAHCWLCGTEYLVFGNNQFDDVMRDASASASGDLMCARCAAQYAEEEEEESYGDWGDWEHS